MGIIIAVVQMTTCNSYSTPDYSAHCSQPELYYYVLLPQAVCETDICSLTTVANSHAVNTKFTKQRKFSTSKRSYIF
jgi:hypothetical protein